MHKVMTSSDGVFVLSSMVAAESLTLRSYNLRISREQDQVAETSGYRQVNLDFQ